MSLFFLLNNLHFALEIFGALVFLVVAWLAFDSWLLRRDFLTASRGIGFLSLAFWQAIHAFYFGSSTFGYLGLILYIFGLLMVLLNLLLERPVARPEFKAVLLLPALTVAIPYFEGAGAFLSLAITYLAFVQYRKELKKTLLPFWIGFLAFALGALLLALGGWESFNLFWIFGHIFELVGFAAVIYWVWQYLQLRIREELMLIFVSMSLFISIAVTLVFSLILVDQMENSTEAGLLTNAKVLDFAVLRFKEEALAKARILAKEDRLAPALLKNDFAGLEKLITRFLEEEKLGFLLVVEKNGDVLMRAHALTRREDNIKGERAVEEALRGRDFVTVEKSVAEGFSIRASSAIFSKGKVIGAIVAGFPLDNALVDNVKRITGLEMTIFENDTVAASTVLDLDRRSRITGRKEVNRQVLERVLSKGESMTVRTEILSRPFLAGYLPIKNTDGEIAGMLSSVKPQQEILDLANTTNRLTLITVVIIVLILILPVYVITRRLSAEVL